MRDTWKEARKRLEELQRQLPEPLLIELTYPDDSTEELPLEAVLKKNNQEWKFFKVISGNKKLELSQFLDWIAPECVID